MMLPPSLNSVLQDSIHVFKVYSKGLHLLPYQT